jgi:CheY-like chemotaxis protein
MKKILVVDDEENIRILYKEELEEFKLSRGEVDLFACSLDRPLNGVQNEIFSMENSLRRMSSMDLPRCLRTKFMRGKPVRCSAR